MIDTILERLKKVKDFRQNQGKRHEIWVVLSIIVLSMFTGNCSYNPHSELPACSTKRYMNYHYYFEPTN